MTTPEPRPDRSCRECGQALVRLPTRHGIKPFATQAVRRATDPDNIGFAAVMYRAAGAPPHLLMLPVADLSDRRLRDVERVWIRDMCQETLAMRPQQVVEHLALLDDKPGGLVADAHKSPQTR